MKNVLSCTSSFLLTLEFLQGHLIIYFFKFSLRSHLVPIVSSYIKISSIFDVFLLTFLPCSFLSIIKSFPFNASLFFSATATFVTQYLIICFFMEVKQHKLSWGNQIIAKVYVKQYFLVKKLTLHIFFYEDTRWLIIRVIRDSSWSFI